MLVRASVALALVVSVGCAGRTGNLLDNPDAEEGTGSATGAAVAVPGWTASNEATVVPYGAPDYPTVDGPGPDERGDNLFSGGHRSPSTLAQAVDVSAWAGRIDGGGATVELSGWLGGYTDQDDHAVVTLTFASETADLGTVTLDTVLAADRDDTTGLLYRSTSAPVPAGTRVIDVELRFERVAGFCNDACADELSLVLAGI